jgi:sugar lactone lactonase YvrE
MKNFARSKITLSLLASFLTPISAASATESLAVGLNPESLTRGFDGNFFITLMGETRAEGDGDGGIAMMEGRKITTFCTGMDDPKGIVLMGDFLITTDFKKVWKINRSGRKEVLASPEAFPSPPLFLNDVTLAPDGKSVLVTDMGACDKMFDANTQLWALDSPEGKAFPAAGRVYRITPDGKVTELIAPNAKMPGPNGITQLKDGTIRVAEFFLGEILERDGDQWKVLAKGHRSADGIDQDSKGRFYVSEVLTGKVTRYEADGSGRKEVGLGMTSAADLLVDEKDQMLIVPDSKAGKLFFIPL